MFKSQRVHRYPYELFVTLQDDYAANFERTMPEDKKARIVAKTGGTNFWDHFNFMVQLLEDSRRRNLTKDADETPEKIGDTIAYMIVMQRMVLHGDRVDGELVSDEHFDALRRQIASASVSYQMTHIRYWSPQYFEDAVRALRRGESEEEAANYLLLG